jgi:hypothetical protein
VADYPCDGRRAPYWHRPLVVRQTDVVWWCPGGPIADAPSPSSTARIIAIRDCCMAVGLVSPAYLRGDEHIWEGLRRARMPKWQSCLCAQTSRANG